MRLNQWLERGGVLEAVERTGSHFNPTRVIGKVLFWFVMFAVIMVAANALGMESLASVFAELVGYIPSLMSAIVILIVGIVLGRFTGGLITASAGGCRAADAGPHRAVDGRRPRRLHGAARAGHRLGHRHHGFFAILFGAVASPRARLRPR
ncbi:MAG: hypothetical protein IPK33_24095 [Gemmatimonadetes bacterium]|nr:hypothetical protein [Gemmatimonadota bacterium]